MYLIVGLGNPEEKYFSTRHNMGFLVVDEIAHIHKASWKNKKDLFSEITEIHDGEQKIILAKPQTYMNDSGKAVAALMHRFHGEPQDLMVISDDVDIPLGSIRVRNEGSAGGHNGLKSVISTLGTQQFLRVKVGVGGSPLHMPLEHWVLSAFTAEEKNHIPKIIAVAVETIRNITHGKLQSQTIHALPSSPLT